MGTRIGIITGRKTAPNRDPDLQVRLLQVQLTDVTDIQTVQLVEQAGEESNPPLGSLVTVVNGGWAFKLGAGVNDGIVPIMEPGGKRIYSIGTAKHEVIAELKLDPDGTITETSPECVRTVLPDGTATTVNPKATLTMSPDGAVSVENEAGSFSMSAAGAFTFHGISATFDCPITAPEATMNSVPYSTHVHPENDEGGPTGVPQ